MRNTLISDLTQRQYAAIGKVACEWSHLEQTLQRSVQLIANIDNLTVMAQ